MNTTPHQVHENRPTIRNTIVNFQNRIKKTLKDSRKEKKMINTGMKNQIEIRLVVGKTKCWKKKG